LLNAAQNKKNLGGADERYPGTVQRLTLADANVARPPTFGAWSFGPIEDSTPFSHDGFLKLSVSGGVMMLANLFSRPSRVLSACFLLALSGCANEALNNQLANSREAIDQAKIAGAQQTAPRDFDAAVQKLNQANDASKKWDKKDAMSLAQEAQVDANLARAKTDSTQARFAAAELEKSNRILRDTYLARTRNSRGTR
jgi:hypothetical protein